MFSRGMAQAIEENEAAMRALGIEGENELQQAMNSLRGKSLIRMAAESVARINQLERQMAELKEQLSNVAS